MIDLKTPELRAVTAIRQYRPFSLGKDVPVGAARGRRIRAEVLRAMIMGLPILGEDDKDTTPLRTIEIEGADIVGCLDLRSVRGADGGAAPAITLRACRILDPILISDGHFGRLSLQGSRFVELIGKQARIDGEIDLCDVASAEADDARSGCCRPAAEGVGEAQGRCSVDLEGATIHGDVTASRATLCCAPFGPDVDTSGGDSKYALSLSGARVHGSLVLQPDFAALGGLRLDSAQIEGNIWLQGGHLTAEWGDALHMQEAHVHRGVAFSGLFRTGKPAQAFVAEGGVWLYGAHIGGELYMSGAKLRPGPNDKDMENYRALNAFMARIDKLVRVSVGMDDYRNRGSSIPFEAAGLVDFTAAILGGFQAMGAKFDGLGGRALVFDDAKIHGDLMLTSIEGAEVALQQEGPPAKRTIVHRAVCRGTVSAQNLTLDGLLQLHGVRIESSDAALVLDNARIRKSLLIQPVKLPYQYEAAQAPVSLSVDPRLEGGYLAMVNTRVGDDCVVNRASLGSGPFGIWATGIEVEGAVRLTELECAGSLNFYSAEVGKDVEIRDVRVRPKEMSQGLELSQAKIGGSLDITGSMIGGACLLRLATVSGRATLDLLSSSWHGGLDADGAQIGGSLRVGLTTDGRASLALAQVKGQTWLERLLFVRGVGEPPMLRCDGSKFEGGLGLAAESIGLIGFLSGKSLERLRKSNLSFYPGWVFVEALAHGADHSGIAGFLWDGRGECIPLTGTFRPLNEINQRTPSPLTINLATIRDYAAFISANFWTWAGPGRMVVTAQEAVELGVNSREAEEILASEPMLVGDSYRLSGIVDRGGMIHRAVWEIAGDGSASESLRLIAQPRDTHLRFEAPLRMLKLGSDRRSIEARRNLDPGRLWPVESWSPGTWEELNSDPARAAAAIASLETGVLEYPVRRVRVRALQCYPGWFLVQGLVDSTNGQALAAWLWNGGEDGRLLDGRSIVFHKFNQDQPPALETDEQAKEYVRLFCAHVWGDDGPFLIVEQAGELPFPAKERDDRAEALRPFQIISRGATIAVEATICYGCNLFVSHFTVHSSGYVEMTDDDPLPVGDGTMTMSYHSPVVASVPPLPNPPPPARPDSEWPDKPLVSGVWSDLEETEAERFREALDRSHRNARVHVHLAAAHAAFVKDDFGGAWGRQVMLRLGGFTYDQIDRVEPDDIPVKVNGRLKPVVTDNAAAARIDWLKLQFGPEGPQRPLDFDPQPHAQLANVYMAVGRDDDARKITRDKLHIEARLKNGHFRTKLLQHRLFRAFALAAVAALIVGTAIWGPALWLAGVLAGALILIFALPGVADLGFNWGFGYGLYSRNAIVTFLAFLLIGWVGTAAANQARIGPPGLIDFGGFPQVLMIDVATVNDAVVRTGQVDRPIRPASRTYPLEQVTLEQIPCGNEIEPFLYAADVFVPLIDLRQESKCSPNGSSHAVAWQWAKALYAFLGWIVTSLTILTISGVLRSRSETR